jgi:hypothetical protein
LERREGGALHVALDTQVREEALLTDDHTARNDGALAQLAATKPRQVGYNTVL